MFDYLSRDESFRYSLLYRLRIDCEYYLGYGSRNPGQLWSRGEKEHIADMKALWNSFPADGKPEWLTWAQIEVYEKKMIIADDYINNEEIDNAV